MELAARVVSALLMVGSVLTAAAMSDRPDRYARWSLWAKFTGDHRRHPRLHTAAMVCAGAALLVRIAAAMTAT